MAGSGTAHLREDASLLRIEHLEVEFRSGRQTVHAVSDVSFDMRSGETLGLVGESGCGKSTTGRAAAMVQPATAGRVMVDGVDMTRVSQKALRKARTKVQMVFQDPISSLNPRRKVIDSLTEPLAVWKTGTKGERIKKAYETLDAVGMEPDYVVKRRPAELSGGQCQRVSIARALMLEPEVLVCDEPVSALDVSVQAQILNLLHDLKHQRRLTMLFIAHDLAVVKNVSDRVAVMYLGKLCEIADPETLYRAPAHPYTSALLDSVPQPDPEIRGNSAPLAGELPSPTDPPSGCRFRTRCPRAQERCAAEEPVIREFDENHFVACHFPIDKNAHVSVARAASGGPPRGAVPGGSGVGDARASSSE